MHIGAALMARRARLPGFGINYPAIFSCLGPDIQSVVNQSGDRLALQKT
jgi:hypothetical protein